MENNSNNSFFDSKNLIAIGLVAVVWIGWQSYLSKKYPHSNDAKTPVIQVKTDAPTAQIEVKKAEVIAKTNDAVSSVAETLETITHPGAVIQLSSQGMGIRSIKLSGFTKRDGSAIQFGTDQAGPLFEVSLPGFAEKLNFRISKVKDNVYEGIYQSDKTQVQSRIEFNPENFSFTRSLTILNPPATLKEIRVSLPEKKEDYKSGGFLIPSYDHQEFFVNHEGKRESIQISNIKESIDKTFTAVSILANANQYFATAIMDKSEIIPETRLNSELNQNVFSSNLTYKITSPKDKIELKFIGYAGPKSHETLESVDPELTGIVDFGYFSAIGKVLLVVLKWFNKFVGNWGFSIILLTLLVRALVLPFNMASTKSMKKMQKIQPQMQAIRERFKDDPQTLQKETMAFMQREKVNPLGGCLPMLLQMPIFFALFRVLGQSIELYQAPFVLWIHDLSIKDPFYVLPVLMGITLFIQQKTTPTTMDPQQAKVMQFMPIIFSFMMVSLPSGLTLYTFVSTLFGVIQQQILMRDKSLFSTKKATA